MRVRQILAGLAALVVGFGGAVPFAAPAMSGGWAATLLDPLPERLEPQRTYTVGFWVLQHGVRPMRVDPGETGEVGIKLVGEDGEELSFAGSALAEPGHYATAVVIPSDGRWRVLGTVAGFMDYDAGVLHVPGAFTPLPVPVDVPQDSREWTGPVRPPRVPVDPGRNPVMPVTGLADESNGFVPVDGEDGVSVDAAGERDAAVDRGSAGRPATGSGRLGTLVLVAVGLLAAAVFPVVYLRRRPDTR